VVMQAITEERYVYCGTVMMILMRSENIEIQFRGGNPKRWHSGTMRIEGGLLTVTAPDGRTKSAQLGGSSPETMARLLLLDLEREKSE